MKEDWTKDIHDRMAGYETTAPDKLWETVEQRLRQDMAKQAQRKRKAAIRTWSLRTAGIAAMLAVALVMGRHFITPQPGASQTTPIASNATATTAPEQQRSTTAPTPQQHDNRLLAVNDYRSKAATATAEVNVAESNDAAPLATEQPQKNGEEAQPTTQNLRPKTQNPRPTTTNPKPSTINRQPQTVHLSLYASGGMASSYSNSTQGAPTVSSAAPDNVEWEDSPMLGIATYNQGREVKTTVKHRQPVRLGMTVSYAVSRRMALEAGVTYTRLTSDLYDGSNSHYIEGTQKLHYVGIPVNLKYRAYAYKSLTLYASTGVLAEKCVKGKQEQTYVLDNQAVQTETADVMPHALQMSVNAAIGAQYNITPAVALYAEPGLSYYFNDGSDVNTIYKEKPLNLNINLGLRLELGK